MKAINRKCNPLFASVLFITVFCFELIYSGPTDTSKPFIIIYPFNTTLCIYKYT